ncbi:Rab11 family-interacting protein 4A [Eumeta japonica]|uniref:Rab11 family-interacting protein 4A n=1 Tax=Eumeta variegata TaxID=151549 RepID=A0A4C1WVY1_EUMVA|nr:Rab11 family-interacting protein 4A [Eumeta japonica]
MIQYLGDLAYKAVCEIVDENCSFDYTQGYRKVLRRRSFGTAVPLARRILIAIVYAAASNIPIVEFTYSYVRAWLGRLVLHPPTTHSLREMHLLRPLPLSASGDSPRPTPASAEERRLEAPGLRSSAAPATSATVNCLSFGQFLESCGVAVHGDSLRFMSELRISETANVQLLQQQVTSLADTQSSADERYARAKADNAVLQARVHMLDEQIREIECRCEERLAEEQRRCREAVARAERDRDVQLAALAERLAAAEADASDLKQEVGRLRGVAETLRSNAETAARAHREAQEQASELAAQLAATRDAERREREAAAAANELLAAAKRELEKLRTVPPPPPDPRLDELRRELTLLRTQNKTLTEAQEELQAQILTRGVEEGRSLLDGVSGPLLPNSLAHELSQMSDDQLQKALKEQQDVNVQLRNYIDGILLAIVENYPQLLEVKYQKRPTDTKS